MKLLDIAIACHEVNAAYCASMGDTSQPSWWNAPAWQRDSALKGAALHVANPHLGPEDSHNAWLAEKRNTGWTYGPVKDPNATPPTHPCFVPYDQLPKENQAKDYIFKAIVTVLASHLTEDELHKANLMAADIGPALGVQTGADPQPVAETAAAE